MLSGLIKRTVDSVEVRNVGDVSSLDELISELGKKVE